MIKRVSLVWKRAGLSHAEFKRLWLGEHAELAKGLKDVRGYVIDFIPDAGEDMPSGVATLRFDSREVLETAFADRQLTEELVRTRDLFAGRVEVFLVDEAIVVPEAEGNLE